METLATFEFAVKDQLHGLRLAAGVTTQSEAVVQLSFSGQDQPIATYTIDVATQSLSLTAQSLMTLTPLATCLLACGITSTIGSILNCLKKSKGKGTKAFLACLKDNGVDVLSAAAACAVKCFLTGSGGGGHNP